MDMAGLINQSQSFELVLICLQSYDVWGHPAKPARKEGKKLLLFLIFFLWDNFSKYLMLPDFSWSHEWHDFSGVPVIPLMAIPNYRVKFAWYHSSDHGLLAW